LLTLVSAPIGVITFPEPLADLAESADTSHRPASNWP
jgi:hypothetical protein